MGAQQPLTSMPHTVANLAAVPRTMMQPCQSTETNSCSCTELLRMLGKKRNHASKQQAVGFKV